MRGCPIKSNSEATTANQKSVSESVPPSRIIISTPAWWWWKCLEFAFKQEYGVHIPNSQLSWAIKNFFQPEKNNHKNNEVPFKCSEDVEFHVKVIFLKVGLLPSSTKKVKYLNILTKKLCSLGC